MKIPTFAEFGLGKSTLIPVVATWWQRAFALPAYHWLLVAGALVACIHMGSGVPWWVVVSVMISAIMQKPSIKQAINHLTKGRLKTTYQTVQGIYVLLGALMIWLGFGKAFGVDVAVSFMLLVFGGKMWELYDKRDGYILLNLALFVLASALLLRQSLMVVLLVFAVFLVLVMGFVIISDDDNTQGTGRIRTLAMLSVPAIPLLVVLFVFFPRVPPLWSLPLAGQSATTGMTDKMSMGDFSKLSQSSQLAFRVEFSDTRPNRYDMYWRGLVLEHFDGTTWQALEQLPFLPMDKGDVFQGTSAHYRINLEPTGQHWLFLLEHSKPDMTKMMTLSDDLVLGSQLPVVKTLSYQADYYHQGKLGGALSPQDHQRNTQLPTQTNPKSQAFAKALFAQAGQDPATYINLLHQYMVGEGFGYTLSPPILKNHRVDEFLFESKAGFCEHYSSSFTFLMRAVGIPARVVVGYQGGEVGAGGTWEVRQMDAHAWSEVWLDGQGWVRIDPTSFVSPDRIDMGMNDLTSRAGASMFGGGVMGQLGYGQFRFVQTLKRYSDEIGYYWQREIVGFDQEKQQTSLLHWFGIKDLMSQFWTLVGLVLAVMMGFVIIALYRRRKRHHPFDLPLVRLSVWVSKWDNRFAKLPHEPYLSWLDRLSLDIDDSNAKRIIHNLKESYRKARFAQTPPANSAKNLTALARALRDELKRQRTNI